MPKRECACMCVLVLDLRVWGADKLVRQMFLLVINTQQFFNGFFRQNFSSDFVLDDDSMLEVCV